MARSTSALILERVEAIDHALRDEDGVLVRLAVMESELQSTRMMLRWMWGAIGGMASALAAFAIELIVRLLGGGG